MFEHIIKESHEAMVFLLTENSGGGNTLLKTYCLSNQSRNGIINIQFVSPENLAQKSDKKKRRSFLKLNTSGSGMWLPQEHETF